MVSISWRQGKKRYSEAKSEPSLYPIHETLKFEISYSLDCESGQKKYVEAVLRKLESAFKMTLNLGDARIKFLSVRQK